LSHGRIAKIQLVDAPITLPAATFALGTIGAFEVSGLGRAHTGNRPTSMGSLARELTAGIALVRVSYYGIDRSMTSSLPASPSNVPTAISGRRFHERHSRWVDAVCTVSLHGIFPGNFPSSNSSYAPSGA
jgi:hypothetical protein